MKRFNWKVLLFLGMAVVTGGKVTAQEVLLDMEIRPRTECRDGFKSPLLKGYDPGWFTNQRTRLGMNYTSAWLTAQCTLQDARVFGQYASASSDASLGLYEAWAEVLCLPGVALKVGRQPLQYDDGRLFSASSWSNTGTAHDLALLKVRIDDWTLHAGCAFNNASEIASESLYPNAVKYRSLQYLWLSGKVSEALTLSLMAVNEGVQDTTGVGTAYRTLRQHRAQTLGGNLSYTTSYGTLRGSLYTQRGENSKGKTLGGTMASLKGEIALPKGLSLQLGQDYFSGDRHPLDATQHQFKKLYGSDHAFNGYMDYWDSLLNEGLLDAYAGVSGKWNGGLGAELTYHRFQTDVALSNGKRALGSELDLLFNCKLNPQAALQAGWCCYFTNDNTLLAKKMASTAEVRFPQWAYVMLTLKPTLFRSSTTK
jgi:hypothetical protein